MAEKHLIGFVALENRSSIAFPVPRLVKSTRSFALGSKAVQACPAVNGLERRLIEIPAPFSLQMRCIAHQNGRFSVHIIPAGTRIDHKHAAQLVTVMPRETWRHPSYPVIQIPLPHFFVSDSLTYLTQMPAWASVEGVRYPGSLIGGRFRADLWPRALNLAFEWTDFNADFQMRRGQPSCYLFPEISNPESEILLKEFPLSADLRDYADKISDVVKYTSGTFSLLDRAKEVRPKKLLKE